MSSKRNVVVFSAWLILAACLHTETARGQGQSPSDAASLGTVVDGIIECGDGYNSHELYDVKISVLEVLRGKDALAKIQSLAASSPPPAAGFDYVLARIKFEYLARGAPGDCEHHLRPRQFVAMSLEGQKYASPDLVIPKPELSGLLHAGKSLEGWTIFLIPQAEKKPVMTFNVDETGAVQHGGDMWFRLY